MINIKGEEECVVSSFISPIFKDRGIQFDFFQPDFCADKYRDIIARVVKDPKKGAIAGGYFTRSLTPTEYKEIDIYVFVDCGYIIPTAGVHGGEGKLNSYLTPQFAPMNFEPPQKLYQYGCSLSTKVYYDEGGACTKCGKENKPGDKHKYTIYFTYKTTIPELIDTFCYNPAKIAYGIDENGVGRMYFDSWFIHGGPMNPTKYPSQEEEYERKGFTNEFNEPFVIDTRGLVA